MAAANQVKAVFTLLLLLFSFSFSQKINQKRPDRGSITFGAQSPKIKLDKELIEPFKNSFVEIARKVIPSVVAVLPTKIEKREGFPFGFLNFSGKKTQGRRIESLGSGVIVSSAGYILTNYHVVAGASTIEIRLSDGRFFPGSITGIDSLSDVAVVKIEGKVPPDLDVIYLGNSDSIEVGDWVGAIGNPFNLASTVTSGIVSALGRRVDGQLTYQNFIQTDAAINPGNSGGALVNLEGALIGINTLILSETGGFMGIGFAIPVNLARKVMEDLIYEGQVIRGYIGISVQDITPTLSQGLDIQSDSAGVLVADVIENQPAAKAGIKAGDIIISINDQPVLNANDLTNLVATFRPDQKITVTLLRNGKKTQTSVTVIQRTGNVTNEQKAPPQPRARREEVNNQLGIGVIDLTADIRNKLQLPKNINGAVIVKLSPDISDERTLLLQGDLITRAKTQNHAWVDINSAKSFNDFAHSIKDSEAVVL
ncbi:MAG: PDZ domain-containing protein, partial [Fibrobacter sp.]|nr:PDZ domain-containing protein [Fibrobacter sp.]